MNNGTNTTIHVQKCDSEQLPTSYHNQRECRIRALYNFNIARDSFLLKKYELEQEKQTLEYAKLRLTSKKNQMSKNDYKAEKEKIKQQKALLKDKNLGIKSEKVAAERAYNSEINDCMSKYNN